MENIKNEDLDKAIKILQGLEPVDPRRAAEYMVGMLPPYSLINRRVYKGHGRPKKSDYLTPENVKDEVLIPVSTPSL